MLRHGESDRFGRRGGGADAGHVDLRQELGDAGDKRLLRVLTALHLASCCAWMPATPEHRSDLGDVDLRIHAPHAHAPAVLRTVEDGRRARAVRAKQEVHDSLPLARFRARRRELAIGIRGTADVEVLSGLPEQARVITPFPDRLGDGARVRAQEG